jgi:hypothetical protein
MTFYIQRKQGGNVETIDEVDDRREAHRLAAEYNLSDRTAYHYVNRAPSKSWSD